MGLLYVKNPKAASSTVMLWLDRLYTGEHSFSTEKSHRDNRLPTAEKIGWEVVSDMLGGSAFRFTFVRNPLGRFESVYHNKVARLGPWRAKVQAILDLPEDRSARVTFEQFLAAVEQEDPLWMNLHWRPQHLNLMHPLVSYDLVGRVETFDREIAVIRRHVNVPEVMVESLNVARTKPDVSVYDGRRTWFGGWSRSTPRTSSSTATEPPLFDRPLTSPGRGSGQSTSPAGNAGSPRGCRSPRPGRSPAAA